MTEENKELKKEVKEEKKEIKKDKKILEECKKQIEELSNNLQIEKEKSMRIQAEMMNFKQRKELEVANVYKYANEDILKELLLISDNFERALAMETEDNKEFLKGFRMIYQSIRDILDKNEVAEISDKDVEFDPAIHQAVLTEKVEGVKEGLVIDVLQKGYKYKDRVLRPAMVKVSE